MVIRTARMEMLWEVRKGTERTRGRKGAPDGGVAGCSRDGKDGVCDCDGDGTPCADVGSWERAAGC